MVNIEIRINANEYYNRVGSIYEVKRQNFLTYPCTYLNHMPYITEKLGLKYLTHFYNPSYSLENATVVVFKVIDELKYMIAKLKYGI